MFANGHEKLLGAAVTRWPVIGAMMIGVSMLAQQPNPRQQPSAPITIYAPEQHDLYDGIFNISASRIYMVGSVSDPPGWDHIDNGAATVKPVGGVVNINVNEIQNSGTFEAALKIPEGDLVLAIDRFNEFAACQNAGTSPTCTSTAATRAAATTTGRRRSSISPGGASATRR